MKRLLVLLIALVATLFGATRLNLIDVRPLANGPATGYMLAVSGSGAWIPVIADPAGSVVIDSMVSPAVLKAAPVAAFVEIDDDFTAAATAQTTFQTSAIPKGRVHVFRNGLLQRPIFTDYTQAVDPVTQHMVITMSVQAGDGVVLSYQK